MTRCSLAGDGESAFFLSGAKDDLDRRTPRVVSGLGCRSWGRRCRVRACLGGEDDAVRPNGAKACVDDLLMRLRRRRAPRGRGEHERGAGAAVERGGSAQAGDADRSMDRRRRACTCGRAVQSSPSNTRTRAPARPTPLRSRGRTTARARSSTVTVSCARRTVDLRPTVRRFCSVTDLFSCDQVRSSGFAISWCDLLFDGPCYDILL
jgi:hypothetical protein